MIGRNRPAMKSVWTVYLVVGAALVGAALISVGNPAAVSLLFTGGCLYGAAGIFAGVVANRPSRRWPWYLLGAGLMLWFAGSLVWDYYELVANRPVPFPSPADAFYVPAYPIQAAGLLLLIRGRKGKSDRGDVIDALIVALGLGVLSWVFVISHHVRDPSLTWLERTVSVAYPFMDIVLLGLLAHLLFSQAKRVPSFSFLIGGLGVLVAADVAWAVTLLQGTFSATGILFAPWIVYLVAWGTAALHPSMRDLTEGRGQVGSMLTRGRLVFLTAAALVAPLVILTPGVGVDDTPMLAVVSGVTFILVIVRMYGLMVDVAEYRRMKKLKDQFVSVVSHELRTPLTSIRGSLGLLAGGAVGELPDGAQRMLDIAVTNTDRLVRLINDILDIERMESGRVAMQRRVTSAAQLIDQAVSEMQGLADAASVKVETSTVDVRIWADPDRIVQTLTNLISNAIKFSSEGGTVCVAGERRDGVVLFSVQDRGRGIPPDKIETIFGHFQQVDASDSRDKGGTGLGLAICRAIVEQHDGEIWAESAVGQGSTFYFTLRAVEQQGDRRRPTGGPRVLICDDDPSVVEVVSAMLASHGYRTVAASSGKEAVESARSDPPDVILLDLLMPGMSGWDALAVLRADGATRDIPVVVLSVVSEDDAELPLEGIVGWVTKPMEADALLDAVSAAFGARRDAPTVLIVEDDVDLAEMLVERFSVHGMKTFHAETGKQAIELSTVVEPDLLVLDLMLPDVDGFQVVDALRASERLARVPLIVYTAQDLSDADSRRLTLGDTRIFVKSRISPDEVESRVVELLDRVTAGHSKQVEASSR